MKLRSRTGGKGEPLSHMGTISMKDGEYRTVSALHGSMDNFMGRSGGKYHVGGQIAIEAYYEQGALHGPWRQWDINGYPVVDASYTHGKRTGVWTYYHKSSTAKLREYVYKDDEVDGLAKGWFRHRVAAIDAYHVLDDGFYQAWVSDSQHLIYSYGDKIWKIDVTTGDTRLIQDLSGQGVSQVGWAEFPRGERIYYLSVDYFRDRSYEIHVLDGDGNPLGPIVSSDNPFSGRLIVWEPMGEDFIVSSFGMFLYRAGNFQGISADFSAEEAWDWSPDGSKILLAVHRNSEEGIYTLDTATWNTLQPLYLASDSECATFSPIALSFSQDGEYVLYSAACDGNLELGKIEIVSRAIVNKETYRDVSLATSSLWASTSYIWSPDNKKIAFVNRGEICVMESPF